MNRMSSLYPSVVLLKTHVWTTELEQFATKIYHETRSIGINFYILLHRRDDSTIVINNKLKSIVLSFTEDEIKSIYPTGFYSMWLSNHWILMWFYKKRGSSYKYFWSMEYDVRISGSSTNIWCHESNYDFLYTMGNYRNINHKYITYYVGTKLNITDRFFGYLQLARYSNKALECLDKYFSEGENGQDELIIFSLINYSGLTKSNAYLSKLIRGSWTWIDGYSDYNKKIYHEYNRLLIRDKKQVYIFHPIK